MYCVQVTGEGKIHYVDAQFVKFSLDKFFYLNHVLISFVVMAKQKTSFQMMCKSGLSHIITMDLHQKEIQGFFDCPVDNLRASPFLLQYIQESVSSYNAAHHWI